MAVRVRLFAALRDLAGAPEVTSEGATVGAVLDDLAARFGAEFARIAAAGSVVVDGERADAERSVAGADEVAVLPPFSGG
ncbi:MAG: MoaD/ThiS family protein [Actinomycetota bacterium]